MAQTQSTDMVAAFERRQRKGGAEAPRPHLSPKAVELRDLLSVRSGEKHVVAIQDFPDPDAISSALVYQSIASIYGIESEILYEGLISHPENLALVNLLEIDLTRYEEDLSLGDYSAAVFVDNQGSTTRLARRLRESGVPTFAVIDHHDPQDLLDPVFRDVRPLGAAATIMAEYLSSGVFFDFDEAHLSHVQLATALLHGLHSETRSFIHACRPEYDAAAFLSRFADQDLLEQVMCVQKSRGTMETIQAALGRRTVRGGLCIAGVGRIRWGDRDAIPQAADFLLDEENVNTTIVYGMVTHGDGRESIIGSLRTSNATMSVDGFLKQALGKDTTGRHYGGGRSRAGGFEIELGFLAGGTDEHDRDAKWALYDSQIRRKLFDAAGLEKLHYKGGDQAEG